MRVKLNLLGINYLEIIGMFFLTFYFIKSYVSLRPKKQKKTLEKFCQDLVVFHYCGKKCYAQSTREVAELPACCLATFLAISAPADPLQRLSRKQHRKSSSQLLLVEIWNYWLNLTLSLLSSCTSTMRAETLLTQCFWPSPEELNRSLLTTVFF